MSNRIHALAQQLTGKATIDECSVEELKHIAKRYPYFASAQFLLLQKLKQLNSPEAETQHQKAALFYHDPLLFNYFISSDKFYIDGEGPATETNGIMAAGIDPDVSAESPETEEQPVSPHGVEERTADLMFEDSSPNLLHDHTSSISSSESIPEVDNEVPAAETVAGAEEIITGPMGIENKQGEIHEAEVPVAEQVNETKSSITEISELTFEPFHTVDYFASQGIKISQEELPKDKLGKQLKSFTEWLKTMKRIPAAHTASSTDSTAEKKVESLADRSVSESEVVTEAMAEVWIKQGNIQKAMEIYNKLSLLNPSKLAYFAAKIENLKNS